MILLSVAHFKLSLSAAHHKLINKMTNHHKASIAERVEALESDRCYGGTPETSPHDFWREIVGHFFQGEKHTTDRCAKSDLISCHETARRAAERQTETPAAQAADSISRLFADSLLSTAQNWSQDGRTLIAFKFQEKAGNDVTDAAADVNKRPFLT